MSVGERIKQLRKEKGYTQEELGNLLGVKKAAVQKYESGQVQNLKQNTIYKLCEIFGKSPNFFILNDIEFENLLREEIAVIEKVELKYGKEVISMFEIFVDLNEKNKEKVMDYASDILFIQTAREE